MMSESTQRARTNETPAASHSGLDARHRNDLVRALSFVRIGNRSTFTRTHASRLEQRGSRQGTRKRYAVLLQSSENGKVDCLLNVHWLQSGSPK